MICTLCSGFVRNIFSLLLILPSGARSQVQAIANWHYAWFTMHAQILMVVMMLGSNASCATILILSFQYCYKKLLNPPFSCSVLNCIKVLSLIWMVHGLNIQFTHLQVLLCVCVCVCVGRDGDLVGDKILLLLCLKSLKMYYLLKMNKKQPFFHFCVIHWNSTSV